MPHGTLSPCQLVNWSTFPQNRKERNETGPSSPAGSSVFSCLLYLAFVQIPLNGAFPSSAPLRAFAQVLVTSISSSFVPSFKAAVILVPGCRPFPNSDKQLFPVCLSNGMQSCRRLFPNSTGSSHPAPGSNRKVLSDLRSCH